jgi:iron complex outermembrane recepter protein
MSKRSFHIMFALIAGLMFVLGDAFFLCAQETNSEEFTLEEITVTAQKRSENQQKVAIAMEVITGDQLTESGKTNVDQILAGISNVMINNTSSGMRITMRGLAETEGTFADMHSSTPTVAINVDGAYNSSNTAGQNLFDIERVEVLMGPQSTLYASTSPGGIVNVVTASPKTDRYTVNASAEVGSYKLRNYQFAGNAPIIKDKLALRLSTQLYKKASFLPDESGENTKSARLKTLYQPNDKLSTTVTINWTKRLNGGKMGGQVQPFDYQDGYWYSQAGSNWVSSGNKVTDPWTAASSSSGGGGAGAPPDGGGGGPAPTGPNSGAQYTKGINGEINWDTGIGSLSVVPQYSRTTSDDQSDYEDGKIYTNMRETQKGVEARMTSAQDFIFKWILGGNYYKSFGERFTTYWNVSADNSYNMTSIKTKAIFANITYPITDKFRANAGYRRTWDKSLNIEAPAMWGTGVTGQDYSSPDYKVGVEYDLAENAMVYASFATSYRINAVGVENENGAKTLPPEKLHSYTLGGKSRLLGNKLQLNVDTYYYDYKNKALQTSDGQINSSMGLSEADLTDPALTKKGIDLDNNGTISTDTIQMGVDPWLHQLGEFRSIGTDISANWLITNKDRVNLSLSYLNAKWKNLLITYYLYNIHTDKCIWEDGGKSLDGYTNTYSPTWTINASYEHNFEVGSYGVLVPHVEVQYKSSYFLDYKDSTKAITYQEPYWIYNGNVTFTHSSGMWTLNAYIKNATNYAAKNFWMEGGGSAGLGISDPRTYGAVLSVKF